MDSTQSELRKQIDRYEFFLTNISDVIWELNTNFEFTYVSANSIKMSGYTDEEMIGHKMSDFLTHESRAYFNDQVRQNINRRMSGDSLEVSLYDVELRCKNGTAIWVEVSVTPVIENGRFIGYIGTTRDITDKKKYEDLLSRYVEELQLLNGELEKAASTDILTGVFSRRKFEDDLYAEIAKSVNQSNRFCLIMFDIDRFKTVNDFYGHKAGDWLLQSLVLLIRKNIEPNIGIYRWGGDEFILLLKDCELDAAVQYADGLRRIIRKEDFGVAKSISVSVGACQYEQGESADHMVSRVDRYLYKAKEKGRNAIASQ